MNSFRSPIRSRRAGFTLTEVLLAIGVLTIAVLALIGLLGPTIGQVSDVVANTEAMSTVSKVNATLQAEDFDDVYQWVQENQPTALPTGADPPFNTNIVKNVIYALDVVQPGTDDPPRSLILLPDEDLNTELGTGEIIDGAVFTVLFEPSQLAYPDTDGDGTPDSLPDSATNYERAYLPMNVRVVRETPEGPTSINNLFGQPDWDSESSEEDYVERNLIIEYPTAVNR